MSVWALHFPFHRRVIIIFACNQIWNLTSCGGGSSGSQAHDGAIYEQRIFHRRKQLLFKRGGDRADRSQILLGSDLAEAAQVIVKVLNNSRKLIGCGIVFRRPSVRRGRA